MKYYVVRQGRLPGIYSSWKECQTQIHKYSGARYKSFLDLHSAQQWLEGKETQQGLRRQTKQKNNIYLRKNNKQLDNKSFCDSYDITCYTDGSCLSNPGGKGGSAALIVLKSKEEVIQTKYIAESTNNISELTAIQLAIDYFLANRPSIDGQSIVIYTDSNYCIGVLTRNWKPKVNIQLINNMKKKLVALRKSNNIRLVWVKGHNKNEGNERVDQLARETAMKG